MADLILKRLKGTVVWDLCTGSGSVGIALKKARPELNVSCSDISGEALGLAQENGRGNGVDVEFLLGDLLAPFEGRTADAVVCNPPYLSEKEYLEIDAAVRDFEPRGR